MRKIIVAVGGLLLATTLTAGVAGAAPAPKTQTPAPHTAVAPSGHHWYAVAGVRRSEPAAKALLATLEHKGFTGFVTRSHEVRHGLHHVRRIEVERMFPDRRAASAEAKHLREAGFTGRIARERA